MTLAHDLHRLVVLMDRRADTLLAAAVDGLTYRRYLTMLHIDHLDGPTQRDLAGRLGTTEPSVSRMVAGLQRDELVSVTRVGGNRRELRLTPEGERLLAAGRLVLEDSFDALVRAQQIDADTFAAGVRALVAALQSSVRPAAEAVSR